MSLLEIVEYWATECDIELTNGEASLLIKLVEEKFTSTNTGSPKLPDKLWKQIFERLVERGCIPMGRERVAAEVTYDIIVRQLREGA